MKSHYRTSSPICVTSYYHLPIGTSKVKAKNILSDSFELVYEVRISDWDSNRVIDDIFKIGGIDAVNLLSPTVA